MSAWIRVCVVIITLMLPSIAQSEAQDRLVSLLSTLNHLEVGQGLLNGAKKNWGLKKLSEMAGTQVQWGSVSRTDTLLTRHFNPKTGKEVRKREITIFLKENQPDTEALLDLVHELVHMTSRPSFDPYDPSLTPSQYVKVSIEGKGGEVDAVMTECMAEEELRLKFHYPQKRCQSYSRKILLEEMREQIRKDFYKTGKWYSYVVEKLGKDKDQLDVLSAEVPQFYSSTGRAPYPVALYHEFEELTESACENTVRRIQSLGHFTPPLEMYDPSDFLTKRCSP